MRTVVGLLCDPLGHAGPSVRRDAWALPPEGFRRVQPDAVPVELGDHGGPVVGRVAELTHDRGGLWAVCVLHDDTTDLEGLYLSSRVSSRLDRTDAVLESVALVPETAQVGTLPVEVYAGAPRQVRRTTAGLGHRAPLLERAARRTRGELLVITDARPGHLGPVELSSHRGRILDVR